MSNEVLFQFRIEDNSSDIVCDIRANPLYYNNVYRGVIDRNAYDIIIYTKCLTPNDRYIDLTNHIEKLPSNKWENLLPNLFYEIAEVEEYKIEWLPNDIIEDFEFFIDGINKEWKKFYTNYALWDKGLYHLYSDLIASICDNILLSSNEFYEIDESILIRSRDTPKYFNDSLMTRFYQKLLNFDKSEVEDLLNYHLNSYTGEKKYFLDKLDNLLDLHKVEQNTVSNLNNLFFHIFPNQLTKKLIGYYETEPYANYRIAKNWIANNRIQIAINGRKVKEQDKKRYTTKQQILILHYLGALDKNFGLPSQNKLIEFLSNFFNLDFYTVRDGILNNKKGCYTEDNLNSVRDLFEEFDLNTSAIVADIDKLNKK